MIQTPLRYEISDWHQLTRCLSNASRDLKISVTDFIQNDKILGLRISVEHPQFGTLFATVIDAKGDLVYQAFNTTVNAVGVPQILNELAKFGFFIQYTIRTHLPQDQLDYLNTLKNLHFDKLRTFVVSQNTPQGRLSQKIVVAFKIENHADWLVNTYQLHKGELDRALIDGTAVNLSTVSETQDFDWSWLDFVANIDDVLKENGYKS